MPHSSLKEQFIRELRKSDLSDHVDLDKSKALVEERHYQLQLDRDVHKII